MTTTKTFPLEGVKVLDLSRMIAAPWAAQILGDLGADVIKVERPLVGDDIRTYGPPFVMDAEGKQDDSPYHLAVNRNKKSVTVDLGSTQGQEIIRGLSATSDIFIENYKVGDLARYGLDYESIRKINPGIIYCSVTGFGQTGPYAPRPGLDSLFQAMSGLMSITGDPNVPPQKVGITISDLTAGMYAAIGILGALRHREMNGGGGQQIDIALLDCQLAALSHRAQTYLVSGEIPKRQGSSTPGNQPAGLYPCQDGEIILSAGSDLQFGKLADALGLGDMKTDAHFATRRARVEHQVELTRRMTGALLTQPRSYWIAHFETNGGMCAPINNVGEAFNDPHVRARGMVVPTPHSKAGSVDLIANPIRYSKSPIGPFATPPRLGEHTDAVLSEQLGYSAADIKRVREAGAV